MGELTHEQTIGAMGVVGSFLLMAMAASILWGMYKAAAVDWAIAGIVAALIIGGLYWNAQGTFFVPEPTDCGYKAMGVGEYGLALVPFFAVTAVTAVMMFKKYMRGLALGFWVGILARVAVMVFVNAPAGGWGSAC